MPPRSRSRTSAGSASSSSTSDSTKPKRNAKLAAKRSSNARGSSSASGDIEDLATHGFSDSEIPAMHASLLAWFDANKRDLPWRRTRRIGDAETGREEAVQQGLKDTVGLSGQLSPEAGGVQVQVTAPIVIDSDRAQEPPTRMSGTSPQSNPQASSPPTPPVTRKRPSRAAAQRGAVKRAKLTTSMTDWSSASDSDDGDGGFSSELSDAMDDDDDDPSDDDDGDQESVPSTVPRTAAAASITVTAPAHGSSLANSAVFPPHVDRHAPGQHAYEVWVSEIMCQQTQVGTAAPYYTKWMAKWPTVFDLAQASIEEVNQTWAGLGYYSRGNRLHASAQLVVADHAGVLPSDPETLTRLIPGIGKYTAGAIASIAYNVPAPVVDGNVIRVLSRLRALGGDPKAKRSIELHWALAEQLVRSAARPGDWNEAVMELGARVCTPTSPACGTCPLRDQCWARRGDRRTCTCASCQTWTTAGDDGQEQQQDGPVDVTIYPRKPAKKAPREETVYAAVVHDTARGMFCIVQRPAQGLLANMWEFVCDADADVVEAMVQTVVAANPGATVQRRKKVGAVTHLFSHIKMALEVEYVAIAGIAEAIGDKANIELASQLGKRAVQWISEDGMQGEAVSTGMKKVFKLVKQKVKAVTAGADENGAGDSEDEDEEKQSKSAKKVGKGKGKVKADPKQPSISSYFQKK